ncbi:major histocompatibility complex class I-related gene protein-like [Chanos chanos]|uniref:Major histocompatibility complex class I-related gene protein-like n=1 Tax=Chanos chanos TaxID=29144 RepID=A0A6J2UP54_CHACN|nr:major histocompatibility complex class I-related gene protein-like [Chanos chanos]
MVLDGSLSSPSDCAPADTCSDEQLCPTLAILFPEERMNSLYCWYSHSLFSFATYIIGETQFPEFSVVVMLDDVQVSYYDSVERRYFRRLLNHSDDYNEEMYDANIVFGDMYNSMNDRASYLRNQLNYTSGVHVYQRLVGCELLDNDKPGLMNSWDAFNGLNKEELRFRTQQNRFQSPVEWLGWDYLTHVQVQWLFANIYHPICIKTLRRYLREEKNSVRRKVKPRVRLLKKILTDSGGILVTCLATGFYPRHINLTLFRDGQSVSEDQITGGILLPNGDGTYQMRKNLEISEEELRVKYNYTCMVTHLSLDNKLNISFDYDPGIPIVPMVSSVVVVCVLMMVSMAGYIIWRRKRAGFKLVPKGGYTVGQSTEDNDSTTDSLSS